MIAAILMLVFSVKSALKGPAGAVVTALVASRRGGDVNLVYPQAAVGGPPDGGYVPVHPSHNLKRGDDGDDGPDYLVGFELLMAQELQFVHQKTPFEAGIFMLPVMVASGFSGPDCRLAGVAAWAARGGDRRDAAQRLQLSRPGVDRFQYPAVAGLGG